MAGIDGLLWQLGWKTGKNSLLESEDAKVPNCAVQTQRLIQRRRTFFFVCLLGPSAVLILLSAFGLLKSSKSKGSRRNSEVLVGAHHLPDKDGHEVHWWRPHQAGEEHHQEAASPTNVKPKEAIKKIAGAGIEFDAAAKKIIQKELESAAVRMPPINPSVAAQLGKMTGLPNFHMDPLRGFHMANIPVAASIGAATTPAIPVAIIPTIPAPDIPVAATTVAAPAVIIKGASSTLIPWQLVTSGKAASLAELPDAVRGNIEHTLSINPGLKMRYLSDSDCLEFIKKHFDDELAGMYTKEPSGHFRGDICRAAVLFREGGFYTDVDLEVKKPFLEMVNSTTTFMSVFTADGHILNAMIATVKGSEVMKATLVHVRHWYKGSDGKKALAEHGEGEWMGTVTLRQAVEGFLEANCPMVKLENIRSEKKLDRQCDQHVVRFFEEQRLECPEVDFGGFGGGGGGGGFFWGMEPKVEAKAEPKAVGTEECPEARAKSNFDGVKYGIFVPGTRQIVAWPRVSTCTEWWCGGR